MPLISGGKSRMNKNEYINKIIQGDALTIFKSLLGEELKPKHALLTSIWRFPPERENPHPAPFPLALPVRCIYSIMDEKRGVVIDPYCGSGTTLVAAKILGHDFIGIEISKEYVHLAEKRLQKLQS